MSSACVFCKLDESKNQKLLETTSFTAVTDPSPISRGHALIIPQRHIETIFEFSKREWQELQEVITELKAKLDKQFNPDGYNIGINSGAAAGQTVFHAHIHVIPRYKGDVANPRGGIRNFMKNLIDY